MSDVNKEREEKQKIRERNKLNKRIDERINEWEIKRHNEYTNSLRI